jgi:ketosteroid isomerase-like protein
MYRFAAIMLLTVWLAGSVLATEVTTPARRDVIMAEKAFAALCMQQGIRTAFLANFTATTIGFKPTPGCSRPSYEKFPANSTTELAWGPSFVEAAAAGDLAVSTGPYELRTKHGDPEPADRGFFVSIWKKQADGAWKVELDCGISTPKPDVPQLETPAQAGPAPAGALFAWADPVNGPIQLLAADRRLWTAMATDRTAWARSLAPVARVYREGHLPTADAKAALELAQHDSPALAGTAETAIVSADGCFGYTYGSLANKTATADEVGGYLRVWRQVARGQWAITLELYSISPRPKTK